MKNGKRPTVQQRKIIEKFHLDSDEWFVTKSYPNGLEIVHRHVGNLLRLDTDTMDKHPI